MIDLDAIKARIAAATPGPWRAQQARTLLHVKSDLRPVVSLSIAPPRVPEREIRNEHVRRTRADADLIAHAPTDIAALVAEVERLRAVLDGPPICACGGTFTEVEYAADEGSPAAFGYHCSDCGWQIGNNGEITERRTLRTNPQTERFIARLFGAHQKVTP